ncbi:MAG: Rieske (2Fe-2S) protein [Planctomycetes bacterium]|nr:Rieske (2Fe-2S) protein [Planctomycetota bacterium]
MAAYVEVVRTTEVPPGTARVVTARGTAIALFNIDGAYFAIDNTCPHRGGPIGEGGIEKGLATCPWHGWQFDVKTGACLSVPSAGVRSYEVRVVGEAIEVALPWLNP